MNKYFSNTYSATSSEPAATSLANHDRWLVNPTIDLLLSCGGLTWLLVVVHLMVNRFDLSTNAALVLAAAVVPLVHSFSEPHIAATWMRLLGSSDMRSRFSFHSIFLPMLGSLLIAFGLCVKGFVGVLLKVYLLWLFQHFAAQSYGLALLYCYKHQYTLTPFDKKLMCSMLNGAAVVAVVRQLNNRDFAIAEFLGQRIPCWGTLPVALEPFCTVLLLALVVTFAGRCFATYFFMGKSLPLSTLMIITTSIAMFASGYELFGVFWLYAPAFFHAAQYLILTISGHLGSHSGLNTNSVSDGSVLERGLRYYATLLLIAVFVFLALPALLCLFGFPYELAFANVFCVVSLHHFACDAAIWKLRDPRLRHELKLKLSS